MVKRRVKNGFKYFVSHRAKPPSFTVTPTSSSSVNSDKCSESMAWPHSRVLLSDMEPRRPLERFLRRLFDFFPGCRYLSNGIVEPPKTRVVNNTMINVVVIITRRDSSLENSKCSDNAYEMAPRNPENHMTACILFVILCSRNLLHTHARGKMLAARPIRHSTNDQITSASSQRCSNENMANPKYANTQVSAMNDNVRIVCCIVICVTVDKLKWV